MCLQGLWRGTVPGQLLAVPYTAVQFVALQQCRSFAQRNGLLQGERAWAAFLPQRRCCRLCRHHCIVPFRHPAHHPGCPGEATCEPFLSSAQSSHLTTTALIGLHDLAAELITNASGQCVPPVLTMLEIDACMSLAVA